ncbi:hypothetical protein TCAL_11960 [Tigriopus californicus]|uniref:UNC93-like protein MFSD11 n=1 Tax=Tigriopus californicus TaxID=6832 RepID=A0A553NB26_TIGCA|nr:UNC93-like protein MFSD11 [Tigriopus californicus]TRY62646.1 hypothetical protein TCAL_11960 [Tigriopus californicus]
MKENTTKNVNVFLLGLAFLLLFTAFQTMGNIQSVILEGAKLNETDTGEPNDAFVDGFTGDGFTSLAILYAVSAVCNWFAPSIMVVMGMKFTLFAGALMYTFFIATFFYLNNYLLYFGSAIIGLGAALIWTAQGAFLTVNSDSVTMSRNSGIFWAMLQCSLLIGNTFAFFQFKGKDIIDVDTRLVTVGVLLAVAILGTITFILLLPTPWVTETPGAEADSPLVALKKSFSLFLTKEMVILLPYFFYMGIQLSFWSGVYGPSLAFCKAAFDDPKSLAGLHGILAGAGEISSGLIFGIFGKVTNKVGRFPVVILGTVLQFTSFILMIFNIPNDAPFGDTDSLAIMVPSNKGVALFCSFMLGFGDACYNTQTMSLLGGVYPDRAGPAFAIFKFVQCVAAAVGFLYSNHLELYYQIAISLALGLIGTATFSMIDIRTRRNQANYEVQPELKPELEAKKSIELNVN